ncbi:MAG TPA: hypothetical protein VEA79_12970 [Phenylobacterium sp.]|nr:hypothetical protein [Phenylobacterium sp.]
MAQPSPYFDSASRFIDEGKANLLRAVADGGTAGKQAFDAAQAQAGQAKQDAVGRAAERSALYGVGGNDQTFLGAYDTRMNQMNVNRANFESGLAQTQASGESYLEKARASIPVLQAQNINKGMELDTKYRTAIDAALAKAQADREKEDRALQRQLDSESRSESRAIAREGRAESRAAAKEAAKPPKFEDIAGQAQALTDMGAVDTDTVAAQIRQSLPLTNDMLMTAQDRYAFKKNQGVDTSPEQELMFLVAEAWGMSPAQASAILTPQKINSYVKAQAPAPALEDSTAKSLASKYAAKGVNYDTAKSVINNVDFKEAVNWISAGADGKSRDEVENIIRQNFIVRDGRNWTAEYYILMGEYVDKAIPK